MVVDDRRQILALVEGDAAEEATFAGVAIGERPGGADLIVDTEADLDLGTGAGEGDPARADIGIVAEEVRLTGKHRRFRFEGEGGRKEGLLGEARRHLDEEPGDGFIGCDPNGTLSRTAGDRDRRRDHIIGAEITEIGNRLLLADLVEHTDAARHLLGVRRRHKRWRWRGHGPDGKAVIVIDVDERSPDRRRVCATARPRRGKRQRNVGPVLARVLIDLGAAHDLDHRVFVFPAGGERHVIGGRPACIVDAVGDLQNEIGLGCRCRFDQDLQMRRLGRELGEFIQHFVDLDFDLPRRNLEFKQRALDRQNAIGDLFPGAAPQIDARVPATAAKELGEPGRSCFDEVVDELALRFRASTLNPDFLEIVAKVFQPIDERVTLRVLGGCGLTTAYRHRLNLSGPASKPADADRTRVDPDGEIIEDDDISAGRQRHRTFAGDRRTQGIDRHRFDRRFDWNVVGKCRRCSRRGKARQGHQCHALHSCFLR